MECEHCHGSGCIRCLAALLFALPLRAQSAIATRSVWPFVVGTIGAVIGVVTLFMLMRVIAHIAHSPTSRRFGWCAAVCALYLILLGVTCASYGQSRPADQLFLPIVTHIDPYRADLTLTNFTTDRVNISYLFVPNNRPVANPNDWHINALQLEPRQSRTVEIGTLGIAGQGMLIVDACKVGGFCSPSADPASDPLAPRYRDNTGAMRAISASVRIYSSNGIGTRGDAIAGTPWYMLPSADAALLGMDHVQITGIKNDGRFSTQIGYGNASQFSTSFITVILYDGAGVERGRWAERLDPLNSVKRGAEQMFPALALNRLNRQPPIMSAWVRVIQGGVVPTEQAGHMIGCENGCPAFLAYASVTDSLSGDFSLRLAEYEVSEFKSSGVAAAWEGPRVEGGETTQRIGLDGRLSLRKTVQPNLWISRNQARPAVSEVSSAPCRITGSGNDFRMEEIVNDPVTGKESIRPVWHATAQELTKIPPEFCGATHFEGSK